MKQRALWTVAAVFAVVCLVLLPLAVRMIEDLRRQNLVRELQRDRPDVVDSDYTAVIKPTDDPLNLIIEVRKTVRGKDKKIGVFGPTVDLAPVDASGKDLTPDISEVPKYAEELDGFDQIQSKPGSNYLRGRVRLIRRELKPGRYRLKPYVRLIETGKDALHGPYCDGGSVLARTGNCVRVELKPTTDSVLTTSAPTHHPAKVE